MSRPSFSSLPLDPSGPPGNAWGLYGDKDQLGALNLLTPARVAAAASEEIRTGERVSLDWPLNKPSHPSYERPPFEVTRKVKKTPEGTDRIVNDDHLSFNTQCSSQWDGFRHFGEFLDSGSDYGSSMELTRHFYAGYQKAKKFYGNVSPEQLHDPEVIGIDGTSPQDEKSFTNFY